MAKEYHTDPYTVAFTWDIRRFDFNLAIYRRYQKEAERERKKHQR